MKLVTSAEMREIDRLTSERFGVPSLTLMENAGSAVAEFALRSYPDAKTFGVICGKGNNGGDGFVVARKLHEAGKEVRVLLLADPAGLKGDAAENFSRLSELPDKSAASSLVIFKGWRTQNSVFDSDVLIDAILGSGFQPPVRGPYAEAIAKLNSTTAPCIAIDVPSGADADVMGEQTGSVARADAIVTFTAPRPAHIFGNLTSGPVLIAPIGSPDAAIQSSLNLNVITPKEIVPLIGPRPRDSNKGMYGHLLVVGGSVGKTGAAVMAGFSALRMGAGLVTVATPQSALATVAGFHPELMTEPLAETDSGTISSESLKTFEQIAERKTVLAIGPGISRDPSTAEFVRTVVQQSQTTIVLDADGLNAFEGRANDFKRRPNAGANQTTLVLTPHPGEMSRLTGLSIAAIQRDRTNVARTFAQEHKVIVVLKGDRTIITNPNGEAWVNTTGNPGMATGGTGDILTGMVAGMLAQNPKRAFEAVLAAVYLHGLAGDIAREKMGEHSLVATDLITALPLALRRVRAQQDEKWFKIES
ncbi:MAG TPA: NAD(P)H-hydrate dehydratase [Terriglobales bacterium]|nr:NAD(P)H-hydrate dehydratase [Terriglobales bacterium]